MSKRVVYKEETIAFILEMCKLFTESQRCLVQFRRKNVIYKAEDIFVAKFGYLELAEDKEKSMEKAKEIMKRCFDTESENFTKDFYGYENKIDKFLALFKYDDSEKLILKRTDRLIKNYV